VLSEAAKQQSNALVSTAWYQLLCCVNKAAEAIGTKTGQKKKNLKEMGYRRFELPTSPLSGVRSNQLS